MKFDINELRATLECDELISGSAKGLWAFGYLREDKVSIFFQFNESEDNASVQIRSSDKRKQHIQAFNLKEVRIDESNRCLELVADDMISKINLLGSKVVDIELKN